MSSQAELEDALIRRVFAIALTPAQVPQAQSKSEPVTLLDGLGAVSRTHEPGLTLHPRAHPLPQGYCTGSTRGSGAGQNAQQSSRSSPQGRAHPLYHSCGASISLSPRV